MLTWSNHSTTGEHFAFFVIINRESMHGYISYAHWYEQYLKLKLKQLWKSTVEQCSQTWFISRGLLCIFKQILGIWAIEQRVSFTLRNLKALLLNWEQIIYKHHDKCKQLLKYSAGQKFHTFCVMTFLWPLCGRGANFENGVVRKYQFFNCHFLFGWDIFIIRGAMLDRVKGPSENKNCTFLNFP